MDEVASQSAETVQAANARAQDVGKGVARVNRAVLQQLGIREGEPVEIRGKRMTAAIAVPPYPEDESLRIIRLDGLQRANAGIGSGDDVELRRADAKVATRVAFAPAQKGLRLQGSGEGLKHTFLHRPVVAGDTVSTAVYQRASRMNDGDFPSDVFGELFNQRAFGLREIKLGVVSTAPKGIVQIGPETEIELHPQYVESTEPRPMDVTFDDIGGLGNAVDQIREMVELPLRHPELFQRLGIDAPKGVLLHGPPGTGKTLLARAVAGEAEATFFHIGGPEIMGSHFGESEQRLRDVFQEAQQNEPAIIFIDEIDSIAPKRSEVAHETERRVVAQLLTLLDGLEPRQNIVVIGATNRVDAIDEALRRPGRFDREVVIGAPDQQGRREILAIHTRGMPLADDVELDEISRVTYGFVGADLASLTREAAIDALRRRLPEIDFKSGAIPAEVLESLTVEASDFTSALRRIQPSAMREIMVQVPDVTWDDIGGLEAVRQQLHEGVELPLKRPEAFEQLGIRPPKGFLLFGPPGTGKTLLAKAVAREANANFIAARSSDLLSKWYGESEQQVARLFLRARQVSPAVIFLDELDSLVPARGVGIGEPAVTERVVNMLLSEMDGLEKLQGVVIIGATNRPNLLDPALLRPGRFDELVYVPVPDTGARRQIIRIHTAGMPLASDVDIDELVERTQGYTGADLEDLTRRAGMLALRDSLEAHEITAAHFSRALKESRASVTPDMEREYEEMRQTLKQEAPQRIPIGFVAAA